MILLLIVVLILTLGVVAVVLINAQQKSRKKKALTHLKNGEYSDAKRLYTRMKEKVNADDLKQKMDFLIAQEDKHERRKHLINLKTFPQRNETG